jgi:serine protease Do
LSTLAALTLAAATAAAPANLAPDFTRLVDAVGPVVVHISATGVESAPEPAEEPVPEEGALPPFDESAGSGVLISADGYIITNNHVVEGAAEIIVRLADGRELAATLVGADALSDIAVIKVEAKKLPVARMGDPSKLRPGEWVLAIGAPFGFEHSATAGIVSAKGRAVGAEQYVPYIQTDVAVNPGNSGGPLINMRGEVVGINSQIYSQTGTYMGISFAIPIDLAMDVVAQLRKQGRVVRGWLGINIQDVTRELAETFAVGRPSGALVRGLADGSPAAAAGVQVGDVILSYDGRALVRSSELPPLVGRTAPGRKVQLKLLRAGKPLTVTATVGELPVEAAPPPPEPELGGETLGIVVRDLREADRAELEVAEGGVLIERVAPGPAAEAGLEAGDVVLMVNQTRIATAAQFGEVFGGLPAGRTAALLVLRAGETQFIPLRVPAPPSAE